MKRLWIFLVIVVATLAVAGSGFVRERLETAQQDTGASRGDLQARTDAAERQAAQLKQQLAALRPTAAPAQAVPTPLKTPELAVPPAEPEAPKQPQGPILTNSMRDIVVDVHQCVLAVRTLRCTFTVTNQSPAEKKFILGIGGTHSRFEDAEGGASVFDDIGNDFLSAGAGVANYSQANCDGSYRCTVEKTLTPGVRTAGWLRFDAVEPKASTVKLLRLKWTDGEAWVVMDFRGIPIEKAN